MGGQKGIYLFLKYFSRFCDVTCYTTRNNKPAQNENFRIKNILSNSRLRYINFFYFFILKKDLRKEGITHLILEHPYYGWLGILLKWFGGIQLVVHSHNIESLRFKTTRKWWWKILWFYERKVYRVADKNFFISEEDRRYAIQHFGLKEEKCIVVTYGTEQGNPPVENEIDVARQQICSAHNIPKNEILLLYNGTLNYPPNMKGLDTILNTINPWLQEQNKYSFTTIICGSKLPDAYNKLEEYKNNKIVYAGLVEDIRAYFLACDIFINPITEGGGIKTKLVEALAVNRSAVSFANGAIGIPSETTGNKLIVVQDHDTIAFVKAIQVAVGSLKDTIPDTFYKHFYWENIAKKAALFIDK
jgi:glycosyltransferase involved in cell wall biosynthesis